MARCYFHNTRSRKAAPPPHDCPVFSWIAACYSSPESVMMLSVGIMAPALGRMLFYKNYLCALMLVLAASGGHRPTEFEES